MIILMMFFIQAEDGIRKYKVTGVQTCALPISSVTAGLVSTADLGVENVAPVTTATLTPAAPNGSNGWYTGNVGISLEIGRASCRVRMNKMIRGGSIEKKIIQTKKSRRNELKNI